MLISLPIGLFSKFECCGTLLLIDLCVVFVRYCTNDLLGHLLLKVYLVLYVIYGFCFQEVCIK